MVEKAVRFLTNIAATAAMPFVLLKGVFNRRFGRSLDERWGLGGWLDDSLTDREVIWFHAASVGEVIGLSPLVAEVRRNYPDLHLLITTTSLTGREEVRKRRIADNGLLFPLDHPLAVRRVLDRVRPRVIVLSETELWPNFLFAVKAKNIPVVLVNGRMSEYSFPRYRKLRTFFRPLLSSIRNILVQTPTDAERFVAVGADPSRVSVAGSTKYSQIVEPLSTEERESFAEKIGLDVFRPIFVAGSVRSGEDEHVIRAYLDAKARVPGLQMIIAPRHPERFEHVERLLCRYGIDYRLRSEGVPRTSSDVVLLDTIGELARAYALGYFAFVGGSLVDIGGHNPFEPAAHRSPVLMGPYHGNVKDAVRQLEAWGGLFVVQNAEELTNAIVRLAENPDECLIRGARACEVWKHHSGALKIIMPALEPYLRGDRVLAAIA